MTPHIPLIYSPTPLNFTTGEVFLRLHYRSQPDSWAYRWFYTCLINRGLSIIPNGNMAVNLGMTDGTHIMNPNLPSSSTPPDNLFSPPALIHPDSIADRYTF